MGEQGRLKLSALLDRGSEQTGEGGTRCTRHAQGLRGRRGRGGDGEVGSDDAGVAGAQRFEGEWGANVTLDRVSWGHSGQGLGGHSLSPGGRKVR